MGTVRANFRRDSPSQSYVLHATHYMYTRRGWDGGFQGYCILQVNEKHAIWEKKMMPLTSSSLNQKLQGSL